jgi:hypothetical protein
MSESNFHILASVPGHKQRHNPEQSLKGIHHWNQAPEHITEHLPAQHILKTGCLINC